MGPDGAAARRGRSSESRGVVRSRKLAVEPETRARLAELHRAAERAGVARVARRLKAVLLHLERVPNAEIANLLEAHPSTVSEWLRNYEAYGHEGLLEGNRTGRPRALSEKQLEALAELIRSGPAARGYSARRWTSALLAEVIAREFGYRFHVGHVRRLLRNPEREVRSRRGPADPWRRYGLTNLKAQH